ncbi:gliding motility lipoprotein GldB [uncultured Eudoraea sp.]|uniref:gliding motility lipoprotein GldB n=1 Tax=uncultured Eudoraea sp. TaxID=1035614 RepID=UPI002602CB5A|nr:gliding motility lipoprotein GldB [uncultured Eudoraea sp.]
MKKILFTILVMFFTLQACKKEKKVSQDVSMIQLDLKVERFDREFAEAQPEDMAKLKQKFPYLFPKQYSDSVWIAKMKDTLQIELSSEVKAVFPDFKQETKDLELLFKHTLYYFPKYRVPRVVTVISDVDYTNRVILADTLLLIGLDNYLGKEHKFYAGIENYIAAGLDKNFLTSDVASTFAKTRLPPPQDRTFLGQMIYYGKELYLKDRLMPLSTDAQKIGYSPEQIAWAEANEEQIWRYFIERELLYSTDNMLAPRFLDPAPFSKFRLELDNESPGRLGRWMGWQIVRSFMENNDVKLNQLLELSADEIFKKSNYKPKK